MNSRTMNTVGLLTAFLLFVMTAPFFLWSFTSNRLFSFILQVAIIVIAISYRKIMSGKESRLYLFYILTTLLYFFLRLVHGMNINGLLFSTPLLFLGLVCFFPDDFCYKVYSKFFTIYAIVLLISLASWLLLRFGLSPSLGIVNHPSQERSYYSYPFLLVEMSFTNAVRFNGPYDEPGVVGTLSALILCINKFRLKDWRNIVILIAGLLSLSLFFYVLCGVYLLLYSLVIQKKPVVTAIVLGLFVAFFVATQSNDIMYQYMWRRMELNEDRTGIEGDNRMDDYTTAYYNSKKGTHEYFFGVDDRNALEDALEGSSSYKVVILYHGVLFFVLYCSFFILMAYHYRKDWLSFAMFVLVFLLTIYQRTNLYSVVFMYMYAMLARRDQLDELFNLRRGAH